jgi:FKBP-type peptidyl-prolyl cis-trans isomerase
MFKYLYLISLFTFLGFLSISCDDKDDLYDPYKQLEKDIQIIDQYLADNNITAQKSSSGLRFVVHDPGIGDYAGYGDVVRLNYEGRLLDGTVFDESFSGGTPIEFVVGYGNFIRGFEEGVTYVGERGKITLYLPSTLAYRNQAVGDLIEPNSILVFYIELISVR